MKVTTSKDQAECLALITILQIQDVFKPVPPRDVCDGILQIDNDSWLVGTNDRGTYTFHALEDCTQGQAWDFFNKIRNERGINNPANHRIVLVGGDAGNPSNN